MTAAVLAFEEEGSGERLVCMPGGPGFPPDYLRSLRELSGSRTVTLLHPRGTGRSPAPRIAPPIGSTTTSPTSN